MSRKLYQTDVQVPFYPEDSLVFDPEGNKSLMFNIMPSVMYNKYTLPKYVKAQYFSDYYPPCPHFEKFLRVATRDEIELIKRVMEALGYLLSYYVDRKSLFLIQGSVHSGKDILLQLLQYILDEEAMKFMDCGKLKYGFGVPDWYGRAFASGRK